MGEMLQLHEAWSTSLVVYDPFGRVIGNSLGTRTQTRIDQRHHDVVSCPFGGTLVIFTVTDAGVPVFLFQQTSPFGLKCFTGTSREQSPLFKGM